MKKRLDIAPLALALCVALMMLLIHSLSGVGLFAPSGYNTYTRQAMAWRQGLLHLPEDVPHLELAVYEGEYYVSFPPVPSLPLWALTFIFGMATPDNLLVFLYALCACLILYFAFKRRGFPRLSAALYAFFICFASCLTPLALEGAVWYQAQLLALLLTVAALSLMAADKPAPALLCFALAVGCRPFNVVYGAALMLIYLSLALKRGDGFFGALRRLLPGVGLGLSVAAAYCVYNYARFGNPLEFGHNYLPEFSFQGGTQFSLAHIPGNAKTFLLGLPFRLSEDKTVFTLQKFGFSLFIANPALALLLVFAAADAVKGRFTREKGVVLLCFALHLFLLMLHRTFGGYQFGARYAVDLLPYAAMYLLLGEKRRITGAETVIYLMSLLFSCYGAVVMHL